MDEKTRRLLEGNVMLFPNRDVIELGKTYPIDDYTIRFVYGEDSVTPTHFVITRFDMPKPVAETETTESA